MREEQRGNYTENQIVVPAKDVETYVQQYFDVQSDYIKKSANYDDEKDTYTFESGIGGGASCSVVAAEKSGDLLTLSFEYYSPDDDTTVIREGILTIQLFDNGDYHYVSCKSEAIG